jgi:hypothetical protein
MKKNYTLFYFYNNIENPVCELVTCESLTSGQETEYRDVYEFLDNHLIEVSNHVVEKVVKFTEEIISK